MVRKVIKKVSIFSIILIVLFCTVLGSIPKKTEAFPAALAAPAIIAALSAFMASAGIEITANGVEGADGLQDIWENITHDFSYDNKALQDWYPESNNVLSFIVGAENASKIMLVGSQFSTWLNELKKWLVNNYSVTSQGSSLYSLEGALLEDGSILPFPNILYNPANILLHSPLEVGQGFSYVLADGNSFGLRITEINPTGFMHQWVSMTLYIFKNGVVSSSTVNGGVYGTYNIGSLYNYNGNGKYMIYQVNNSGGSPGTAILDITDIIAPNINSMGLEGALTDGYADFEQALEDAQTQSGTGEEAKVGIDVGDIAVPIPLTEEGLINGIIDSAIDNTLTGELTGGYTDEKEAEEENNASLVPSEGSIANNIVVVDGLEDFFPFCIPWDLYNLISYLNVPPEAPEFDVNIGFAGLFNQQTIHMDFSSWDTAARIFRITIVIAFVIFLILKTRDLIRG